MSYSQIKLQNILNFEELGILFRSFSTTCGLDVALFDLNGKEQFCIRSEKCICNFIQSAECNEKIAYSGRKAVELGTSYVYETPCGLVMCISPVFFNEEAVAFVTCGPVRLWENDEYFANEFYDKCLNLGFDAHKNAYSSANIKHITCEYMTGLAGMLSVTVEYIAKEQNKYLKKKHILEQLTVNQLGLQAELKIKNEQVSYKNKNYPLALEKELLSYVILGEKNKAKTILNNFLNEIFSYASGNLEIIKIKLYEFTAFLSRAAVEFGAELGQLVKIVKKSAKFLNDNIDFISLCENTVEILEEFMDTVYESKQKKKSNVHLANAMKIINEEYFEEITLDNLSKRIFVSPYYLSHLFRDELKMTFSDYLTKVRIDHAKKFLSEGETVERTAEHAGFNDTGYFMKTFKRYVGITPAKYRKSVYNVESGL